MGVVHNQLYDYLALVYDQLMNHVNYRQWARYINALIAMHGKKVSLIGDFSCGTGSLLPFLRQRRRYMIGSDRSPGMLLQAKRKTASLPVALLAADFQYAPFKSGTFDVILILYDSINYILQDEDISTVMNGLARVLKKNGLLIFDAIMPNVCRNVFNDFQESQFFGNDRGYERKAWYEEDKHLQYNEFRIYNNHHVYSETHIQKIREVWEWRREIEGSSLEIEAIYSDFTFRPVRKKTERAHFVCKRMK